jgi:hypothetical protein
MKSEFIWLWIGCDNGDLFEVSIKDLALRDEVNDSQSLKMDFI